MRSPEIMNHAPSITAPRPEAADLCDWASRGPLVWEQPKLMTSEWILRAGTESLATLRRDHWYGMAMTATTPRGTWKLGRNWIGRIAVRHGDAEQPAVIYNRAGSAAARSCEPGRSPCCGGAPASSRAFTRCAPTNRLPVLRVRPVWDILRHRGSVEFETRGRTSPRPRAAGAAGLGAAARLASQARGLTRTATLPTGRMAASCCA